MIRNEKINEVEGKIRKMASLLDTMRSEKETCLSEVKELESRIVGMEDEMDRLKQKYETLKLAKSISGESSGSGDARTKINNIVRELDRCIALLNQ